MERTLLWLNIGIIFISIGAYISPFVSPDCCWLFSVLGLFYPWLLLINVIFIGGWLISRKWHFLLSFFWILAGMGHFTGLIGFNTQKSTDSNATHLNVMTYNCRAFAKDNKQKRKVSESELIDFIKRYNPDVICFQEFPLGAAAKKYTNILLEKTNLKYHFQDKNGQLALFSTFPIKKKGVHYFTNRSNGYLFADIEKGKQTVRFFNIHLQSNVVTTIADKVASEGKLQEKETWLSIKGMLRKYRHSARIRVKQAKVISENIKRSPYPAVICGDFNDVPQSNAYHILATDMQDAFKKEGSGLGTTYAGSIPGLRIDYILPDRNFFIQNCDIIKVPYSDHYPVSVSLFPLN